MSVMNLTESQVHRLHQQPNHFSTVVRDLADKVHDTWAVVFRGELLPGRFAEREEAVGHLDQMENAVGKLKAADHALETFERTEKHLIANNVNLAETKLRLGAALQIDAAKERFADNQAANALLARENRSPFNLPHEKQL